jgi:hypothetical protein
VLRHGRTTAAQCYGAAEQSKATEARVWGVCGDEMRRRGVAGAFKEGPGILGGRAQERKPAKISGFRCARERGTRDEEGDEADRWGRGVSDGARVRCGPSGVSGRRAGESQACGAGSSGERGRWFAGLLAWRAAAAGRAECGETGRRGRAGGKRGAGPEWEQR